MKKTITFISGIALLSVIFALVGCSSSAPEAAKTEATAAGASGPMGASGHSIKKYPMQGKVLSLNAAEKSARIDAGAIGDWMGPMTMNYAVKDAADFAKLSAGVTINATVFVDGDDFWVGEVNVAGTSAATGK